MRSSHVAVPCLLALGFAASAALAGGLQSPLLQEAAPLENRAGRLGAIARHAENVYRGTLSGTLIRQAQATTSWLLYPGACNDRSAGTWAPRWAGPIADDLDSYDPLLQDHGYGVEDLSVQERLWHIDDGTTVDRSTGNEPWPLPINGARSLWCGKTHPIWSVKSGYPNLTFQILYIDTDPAAAGGGTARSTPYTLSWTQYLSTEFNYDYLYVIGGSSGKDPIGNDRAEIDRVIESGADAGNELLVGFTGSQENNLSITYAPGGGLVVRGSYGAPNVSSVSIAGIPASHRAIYIVLVSDTGWSSEDGGWALGHGAVLDLITTNDQGPLYDDQPAAGGTDAFAGAVLVGTPSNPLISARVAPAVGGFWEIRQGSTNLAGDFCSPEKDLPSDLEFAASNTTTRLTNTQMFSSIRTCSLPVPPGAAAVEALWDEYIDLPGGSGMVQYTEYRLFRDGAWGNWRNPSGDSNVRTGSIQAWITDGAPLPGAADADSVQLRYVMRCLNYLTGGLANCLPVTLGVLYDNFRLQCVGGVAPPYFAIFPGSVAQTTFVDGSDPASVNCAPAQIAAGQCWPGIRGSNLAGGIDDNFNSPLGDSIVVSLGANVRKDGMGINWRHGFDKSVGGGRTIAHTDGSYMPGLDVPRVIYRLFDPATKTWSPFDSSELDADDVQIAGPDTALVNDAFRMDWPPRDKLEGGASLPGGFSINGRALYSELAFLPQGCRLQYYFKAVDKTGAIAYQFSTDNLALEVEDLPTLPGSAFKAPDVIEFDVLPRVYPAGAAGTLLAGRTDTPVLNLEGGYSTWSHSYDPVTQALRMMGVRADRYRALQGLGEGNGVGGHEWPGQPQTAPWNYFPNTQEYGILAKLANQYRIIIQSSHLRNWTAFSETDAGLVHNWWDNDTGTDGGDRCILATGDDMFNTLLNGTVAPLPHLGQVSLAQNVFGVASCIGAWTGANTTRYPTVTDNFTGITYPLDGGCPNPNRFDGLTKGASADITVAASYPGGVTEVAGVARSTENDGTPDNDRSKALAYGFSIQFIRTAGIPTSAANYVSSGVENRARVLFKFLTSCRGQRTPSQTMVCWPCPSSFTDLTGNWAAAEVNFGTATAGPLYPIQDNSQATGVDLTGVPKVNHLEGNFPNPFNPETSIRFSAATAGRVTVRIFDVAGRVVNTLTRHVAEPGASEVRWNGKAQDGRRLASGVYFYRIRFANGQESEAKMTMLK